MKIIISPAKKMNVDCESIVAQNEPYFLTSTEKLLVQLKTLSYEQVKGLWGCSDTIAKKQYDLLHSVNIKKRVTPAILAYEGIQYKYMAPHVFETQEFAYAEKHLRIVSGFYGLLHPLDGVVPYRLEMQAKLKGKGYNSLYEFWGDRIAKKLSAETNCVINLASKEYSKSIQPHLPDDVSFITCVFAEQIEEKIVEKGTMCKIARGEMVRFLTENRIKTPKDVQEFNRMQYRYAKQYSNEEKYVFLKGEK